MYKIITDIAILTAINEAAKLRENNSEVNYCEVVKHPINEEWAIPIIESILWGYELPFINDLLDGLIETLPQDWNWIYIDRPIRIIIPLWVQAKALTYTDEETKWLYLKELVLFIRPYVEVYTLTDKENVTIYLEELYPQHEAILSMFEEIKIETKL